MKIRNVERLNDFICAVNECKGQVWLESNDGDRFNLKSVFSRYIAFNKLFTENDLELVCLYEEDECLFKQFEAL